MLTTSLLSSRHAEPKSSERKKRNHLPPSIEANGTKSLLRPSTSLPVVLAVEACRRPRLPVRAKIARKKRDGGEGGGRRGTGTGVIVGPARGKGRGRGIETRRVEGIDRGANRSKCVVRKKTRTSGRSPSPSGSRSRVRLVRLALRPRLQPWCLIDRKAKASLPMWTVTTTRSARSWSSRMVMRLPGSMTAKREYPVLAPSFPTMPYR
jgi:hypothetical protein